MTWEDTQAAPRREKVKIIAGQSIEKKPSKVRYESYGFVPVTIDNNSGFATTELTSYSKTDVAGTRRKTSVEANRKTYVGAHRKTSIAAKKKPSVAAQRKPYVAAQKKPSVAAQRKPSVPEDELPSLGWYGGAVEGTSPDEREQPQTTDRKESQKTPPTATGILTDKELVNNYKNVKLCQRNIHAPFYWFYSYSVNYTFAFQMTIYIYL